MKISYAQLQGDVADADIVIPGKRKWHIRDEDRLQIACVKLLRQMHIPFIVAQPERLNARVQRRDWFKKLGILGNAGHPELIVFAAPRVILCELKTNDGKLSAGQRDWQTFCVEHGYVWAAPRSVDHLRELLEQST